MGRASHEEPWHRQAVGGLWEQIGRLQLDFLRAQGLQPHHSLLDIGCGSLRAGVHLIAYLERGRYVGVDRDQALLDAGRDEELGTEMFERKQPTLLCDAEFDFDRLGRLFDVTLAQSLFTHLPANAIVRCLAETERALVAGGELYATFFEAPNRRWLEPIEQCAGVVTYLDRDPYHYDPGFFVWACEGTALSVSPPFDWGHPRNQRMLIFSKSA